MDSLVFITKQFCNEHNASHLVSTVLTICSIYIIYYTLLLLFIWFESFIVYCHFHSDDDQRQLVEILVLDFLPICFSKYSLS